MALPSRAYRRQLPAGSPHGCAGMAGAGHQHSPAAGVQALLAVARAGAESLEESPGLASLAGPAQEFVQWQVAAAAAASP